MWSVSHSTSELPYIWHTSGLILQDWAMKPCLRHFHAEQPSVILLCWFCLLPLWPEYCLVSETRHPVLNRKFLRSWRGTLWLVSVLPPVWTLEAAPSLSVPVPFLRSSVQAHVSPATLCGEDIGPSGGGAQQFLREIFWLTFLLYPANNCPESTKLQFKAEYTWIGQNMPSVFHSVDYASFSSHFRNWWWVWCWPPDAKLFITHRPGYAAL